MAARRRLFVFLFIIFALPVSITLLIIESELGKQLEKQVIKRNKKLTEVKTKMVEEYMSGLIDYVEALGHQAYFSRLINKRSSQTKVSAHLEKMIKHNEKVDMSFVTDTNGTLLYHYPKDTSVINENFAFRDWYRGVTHHDGTYVSEIFKRASAGQPFGITIVTPIYHPETHRKIGYFGIHHSIEKLMQFLDHITELSGSKPMLIDHKDNLAIKKDELRISQVKKVTQYPALQQIKNKKVGTLKLRDPLLERKALVSYATAESMNWIIFSSYPLSKINTPIFMIKLFIILTVLVCFILILLVSYYWLNKMRRYHEAREKDRDKINSLNKLLEQKVVELRSANEELESFSYSVSHDLQSPLRAIHGYTRILLEDHKSTMNEEVRELLGIIDKNTHRMSQLIEDLLAFSRLGRRAIKQQAVDMKELVQETVEEKTKQHHKNVDIQIHDIPHTTGDPNMLKLVWDNLISNALKYTSKVNMPRVEIGYQFQGGVGWYYVADNGVGFDQDYAGKLFTVFQRLHSRQEFSGTGIGLALVYRIIKKHGGQVWGAGEKNNGAAFYFRLDKSEKQ